MTDAKSDRRSQRTRDACLQAFISLLLSTDYDTITVNQVIEKANVGRSTFYDHFTGKEDLLRHCIVNPFAFLADGVIEEEGSGSLRWVVGHLYEQRRLVRTLMEGGTRSFLIRSLAGLIEERIAPRWAAVPSPVLPVKLAALALAETQLGSIFHWLGQNAASCPPERFALALGELSRGAAAQFRAAASIVTPPG